MKLMLKLILVFGFSACVDNEKTTEINNEKVAMTEPTNESTNNFSILGARFDEQTKEILIDVRYSGGCKEHEFELKLSDCKENTCQANLHQISGHDDYCKGIMEKTVNISARKVLKEPKVIKLRTVNNEIIEIDVKKL